jgi:hypothetical protein
LKNTKNYDIIILQKERESNKKGEFYYSSTEWLRAGLGARFEKLKKFCYNIFTNKKSIKKILRDTRRFLLWKR